MTKHLDEPMIVRPSVGSIETGGDLEDYFQGFVIRRWECETL